MAKVTSSFKLENDIWQLLQLLADKQSRSKANMLEILIKEAAEKEKIKVTTSINKVNK